MDSNVAVGADKRSFRLCQHSVSALGFCSPLKAHRRATEVRIITSLPSSQRASHNRSCWAKGTVLTKSVIYHFVPQAEEEIIFRCFDLHQLSVSPLSEGTDKRLVDIRHEPFHQSLLDVERLKQSRETRCEDRVHPVDVVQPDQ